MDNLTVNQTTDYVITKYDSNAVLAYFISAGVLGVTLNLLTIFSIGLGRNVNKSLKIQLINLAVADCLMAAFYPYAIFLNELKIHFYGSVTWCAIYALITLSALHASPLCSAAISLEQFVIIYFPLKAPRYGTIQKYIVVGVIWLCAILPEIFNSTFASVESDNGVASCKVGTILKEEHYNWIQTSKYIVPVSIIVVCYSLVLIKLCLEQRNKTLQHSSGKRNSAVSKFQAMLAVDAFLTVVTWLPYSLYHTIEMETSDGSNHTRQQFTLRVVLAALIFTNAFSTPIIYLIFSRCFRMDVKLLLLRTGCCIEETKDASPDVPNKTAPSISDESVETCPTVMTNIMDESRL